MTTVIIEKFRKDYTPIFFRAGIEIEPKNIKKHKKRKKKDKRR